MESGQNNNNNQHMMEMDPMDVESFETEEAFIRPSERQIKLVVDEFATDRKSHLVANDADVSTLATTFVGDVQRLSSVLSDFYGKTYNYVDYISKVRFTLSPF